MKITRFPFWQFIHNEEYLDYFVKMACNGIWKGKKLDLRMEPLYKTLREPPDSYSEKGYSLREGSQTGHSIKLGQLCDKLKLPMK